MDLYRRLPEDVRRCLRPLNLADECASFLPPRPRAWVGTGTEMVGRVARLRHTRYPVRRLEGRARADGTPLECLLAADELSAGYWRRAFFDDTPTETVVEVVSALGVAGAARRLAASADLSLWQASWPLSILARRSARVPSAVPLWLDTTRPLEAIVVGEPAGRASRKDDVRRARRLALTVRVATDASECEAFRCDLYEPYTRRRYGRLFAEIPPHVFRHAWRSGWLVLLEREGRTVAGALLERWAGEVRILAFGVDPDGPIPTDAALEACYYHAIAFACLAGIPRLSLGACRPVLTDGVLRYKRKWGAAIGRWATWDAHVLRYRNTAPARAALAGAPLVVVPPEGGLIGVVGTTGSGSPDALARVATPGLAELACLVGADAAGATAGGDGVRRVVAPAVWPPAAAA
jgi:hypothetical protein